MRRHGLQKYPTLSARALALIRHGKTGANLIFVGVARAEKPRRDGKENTNKMFMHLRTGKPPYFREFPGPWTKPPYYSAEAVTVADINGDGLDDFIVCASFNSQKRRFIEKNPDQKAGQARMYVQQSKGTFLEVKIPFNDFVGTWRDVRVAHIRKRRSLITVEGIRKSKPYVRIFKGISKAPYFDFSKPIYSLRLPHAVS